MWCLESAKSGNLAAIIHEICVPLSCSRSRGRGSRITFTLVVPQYLNRQKRTLLKGAPVRDLTSYGSQLSTQTRKFPPGVKLRAK